MPRPFQTILPLLLLAAPAIAQTHRYQVLDLGVLSGQTQSTASAINASGAVVGNSGNRPFVFRNCTISDLGILPNGFGATATGINNDGHVSGYSEGSDKGIHAVDWHDGSIHLLLAGNTYQSQGLGITNTGRVIGYEYNGAVDYGIAFDDDLPIVVPSDDDPTYGWASVNVATGGNSSGQFTGYRQIYNSLNQFQLQLGLVTLPGTSTWKRINPPSSFTGDVYPWAINESGATSGWIRHYAGAAVSDHAFLSKTTAAIATDLGTLGGTTSHAYALNNARWVVGASSNASNATPPSSTTEPRWSTSTPPSSIPPDGSSPPPMASMTTTRSSAPASTTARSVPSCSIPSAPPCPSPQSPWPALPTSSDSTTSTSSSKASAPGLFYKEQSRRPIQPEQRHRILNRREQGPSGP
jgi:probable HAF family extracellular repeat protein